MFNRGTKPAQSKPSPQFGQMQGSAQNQQQQQSQPQQAQADSRPIDPAVMYIQVCGGAGRGPG